MSPAALVTLVGSLAIVITAALARRRSERMRHRNTRYQLPPIRNDRAAQSRREARSKRAS